LADVDAVEDELANEELELLVATGELLLDELGLLLGAELELDELVVTTDELLLIAAELADVDVLLEPPPLPPQADTNKLRVNNETRLRLRMMTPLIFMLKAIVVVN
jgi:hypothetical protein